MPPTTRRRRPTADRQRELLAAALDQFSAHGFEGASVQDIAREAGVATGTVYLYFPSKEHLLLGLHAEFHEGLLRVFSELAGELTRRLAAGEMVDVAAASDRMVDALVGYSVEHRAHCTVLTSYLPRVAHHAGAPAAPDGPFAHALGAVLEDATERGLVDLTHPRVAARLLATATIQTIGPAVADGDAEHLTRLTEQTKELFRRVLTTERSTGAPARG